MDGLGKPDPGSVDDARLGTLRTACADADVDELELARLALHHAVTATGALAGFVHLRAQDRNVLRLAAISGLRASHAVRWEDLPADGSNGPARAMREGKPIALALSDADRGDGAGGDGTGGDGASGDGIDAADGRPLGYGAAAMLVLPIPDSRQGVGTLTLITTTPVPEERRAFLSRLVDTVGTRPARASTSERVMLPWWSGSGSRLREAMAGVRVATWEWDMRTGELLIDEVGFDVILKSAGLRRDEWDNRVETWMQRVHPDDLEGVLAAMEQAIARHEVYSVEYRVRSANGRVNWVELRGHTTYADDETPLRMTGTGWMTTAERMTEQAVTRVLRHLPDAFLIVDPADGRVLYANDRASLLATAHTSLTGRTPWEVIPELADRGLPEQFAKALDSDLPVTVDIRLGETWQRLRLVVADPYLVVFMADVTAKLEAERAAVERGRRIGALAEALAQSLTTRDVVDAVAAEILPAFGADSVLMYAREDTSLRLVGTVGYDPALVARLRDLDEPRPLYTDVAQFIPSLEAFVERYPELADLARSGERRAWALLPLTAGGHPVGSCVIGFLHPRSFAGAERGVLIALSGLIAQAMERARLYDREHERARRLQEQLLPWRLPQTAALTSTARYRPAGKGVDVGGDWYDAIPLSAERVALVIGDVMGHGLSEAITMSRLRTAVSTLAILDHPPEEMLAHLNDVVAGLDGDLYVTCLYAVYDSTTGVCTLASAGQPPPAVVDPDGTTRFLEPPIGPPLGTAQLPYQTLDFVLSEGSLLVLYTDGLIGVADSDPEVGMSRLHKALTDAAGEQRQERASDDEATELGRLCDSVIGALLPGSGHSTDDAAIMAVRAHRLAPEHVVSRDLPFEPSSAGLARELVRDQLPRWGWEDLIPSTELVVSELIGNTIRHAAGPIALRLIRGTTLTCEIQDGSQSSPRTRHAALMDENGRGLQLVAAMTHRWGTRYTSSGSKTLWTEQLPPASRE
ncbi:SpoIIE family protein phosphatase [Embleya sp. NPDC050154]|uniref:SpoIIE family protein phosphatase n=1 Tax=Embleya sp. NPDC050154 TaxID=3363988 RepID=UPI003790BCFA